jgi:hypothetical protein
VTFMESMEGPIGDGFVPLIAPIAHPNVFGVPPPVVRPDV